MTTEIAIMNKTAVALAADSAVTIGHVGKEGMKHKIFNTANKLFTLSKYAPVGIMIYGGASLMGFPWETIVKTYRKQLNSTVFASLNEYCENFFKFLDSFTISPKHQKQYINGACLSVFGQIKTQLDDFVKKNLETNNELSQEQLLSELSRITKEADTAISKNTKDSVFSDSERISIKHKYAKEISNAISSVFWKIPISKALKDILSSIAISAVSIGPQNQTGIVITGFGENEFYPTCCAYDVRAIFEGKAIKVELRNKQISDDNDSTIIPFAQSDEVCTFMEGISQNLNKFFQETFSRVMIHSFPEAISEAITEKLDLQDIEQKDMITEVAKEIGKGVSTEILQKLQSIKQEYYINPVVKATSHLNKSELAAMAETLVNLVSFRKQVTLDAETVGGPIDVAVISKGDGFVWIKRKHYFDPTLNHHFFKNYFSGDISNEKE